MEGILKTVYLKSKEPSSLLKAEIECFQHRFHLRLGDRSYKGSLMALQNNSGILQVNEKLFPFCFVQKGCLLEIWIKGKNFTLEILHHPPEEQKKVPNQQQDQEIPSPMPGRIVKIHVQAGEHVKANQALLVMESMKMEMTISAPFSGKVESIFCQAGDLVEMGQLLIKLGG